ncbi:iron ABC transporter permease [Leptolyngbyaceae cyanobacterium CCMR0082]|uniref:Iron ABC transporter permease n=2 Tax=Adonisia turfae TaxID=2950184 RepID=A0A6M0SA23_9CYAN|nr:iron ABC transporter permease [Adonisia turfae]NEZ56888.1 iron ABC transporter permease [Adonisia turfae CCMR0081]NEZ64592.1 iron ABC transporter permease [Adonisia turfae CCMR0082]
MERVKNQLFIPSRTTLLTAGYVIGISLLLTCLIASIALGVADIAPMDVYQALVSPNGSTEHLIIRTVRLPRSITALLVGAAVAVSGAIMQGLTRNPLADPGILGINSGAALAVVVSVFWFNSTSLSVYAGFALVGAAIAAVTVYGLGSLGRGGLNPLNLTIAGAALTALVSSLTTGILILSQRTLEEIRFWLAGSVAGRDMELVLQVMPFLLLGLVLGLAMGKQLTTLSLGDAVAKGLGQKTIWVKVFAAISVVLLAGGSVAIAGPIGFLGLIVPHIVRFWAGADYRWILPYSALCGAILLLLADIGARLIIQPQELPVGIVMPLLGAPFFIYLTRSRVRR